MRTITKTMVPKSWGIPEVFRERLGMNVGRQRLMIEEGHQLVVLHMPPSSEDRGQREPALFWISAESEWKSMPETGGRIALKQLIENYQERVNALDEVLDEMGGFGSATEIHHVVEEVTPLLRAARNLAAVMQSLRQANEGDREVLALRDMSGAVELSAELLLNDAKSSLEYFVAKSAQKQADEAKKAAVEAQKLNKIAAFFFPLVTLASLFGMNPPEALAKDGAMVGVIVLGLFLGGVLVVVLGGRKGAK